MSGEALREPWTDLERQKSADSLGIWLFLASELLFFGGLFLGYAFYRSTDPRSFAEAARHTDIVYGTINTAILLTSSLSVALASRAAEAKLRRLTLLGLTGTVALAAAFLVVKGFEYREDLVEHLLPGPTFGLQGHLAQLFFAFYWVMTGVHALHVTIGMGMIGTLALQGARNKVDVVESPITEVLALYWHLVDAIWIVLYPLLYLVGRT